MKDPTMGMCGYNATLRSGITGAYCPTRDSGLKGCPNLLIDPRRVPCCGGSARCEAGNGTPPMCCQCKPE